MGRIGPGAVGTKKTSTTKGEGVVPEKLPQSYFDDLASKATRNPDSSKVIIGKFLEDGKIYTKVGAHYKASYFKFENWRNLSKSLKANELWQVNKTFLQQQIKAGKEVVLSHDPLKATGFYKREVNYLNQLGYKFIQDGWVWKAVQ